MLKEYPPFDSSNPTLIRRIVNAYGEMIQERIDEGYEPYLLSIMFKEIRGPRNGVISQMLENTATAYDRSLTRIVRNPRSPSQQDKLPIWIACPDFPVAKGAKKQLRDVALNDGLHVHGIALLPPVNRLKGRGLRLDGHFVNQQRLYAGRGTQISRIVADPITQTPKKAVDYSFKALKRGRVTFDDIWIFPRSRDELSLKTG
jgi:hypothetical protein